MATCILHNLLGESLQFRKYKISSTSHLLLYHFHALPCYSRCNYEQNSISNRSVQFTAFEHWIKRNDARYLHIFHLYRAVPDCLFCHEDLTSNQIPYFGPSRSYGMLYTSYAIWLFAVPHPFWDICMDIHEWIIFMVIIWSKLS